MDSFRTALLRYLPLEYLEKISDVTVGVAGCGGIGSNCSQNLVRCGFRRFLLVDYDTVEPSNLNRQFFFYDQIGKEKVEMLKNNLLMINPDLDIATVVDRVTPDNMREIFKECSVIIEGFDDPVAKREIVEGFIGSNKLIVAVSGIAGSGNSDLIVTKKINKNFYVVGDFRSEVSDTLPPYSPYISIAAAKQADIVLNYFLNSCESVGLRKRNNEDLKIADSVGSQRAASYMNKEIK